MEILAVCESQNKTNPITLCTCISSLFLPSDMHEYLIPFHAPKQIISVDDITRIGTR